MTRTDGNKIAYLTDVYRQINEMIRVRSQGSTLIDHKLEKGLSNEEIVRDVLRETLPKSYGVAKGKVANSKNQMNRQCDVIVYDALNCPNLFLDSNRNQVLPVEGVYAVIEVKTTLTHSKLRECFENISSIKRLSDQTYNASINDHVRIIPPLAYVIALRDTRTLSTIHDQYAKLNQEFETRHRSLSFDKRSPGYCLETGKSFLVEAILVLDKGIVLYQYSGKSVAYRMLADSFGSFIVQLYLHLHWMKLSPVPLSLYYRGYEEVIKVSGESPDAHKRGMKSRRNRPR